MCNTSECFDGVVTKSKIRGDEPAAFRRRSGGRMLVSMQYAVCSMR